MMLASYYYYYYCYYIQCSYRDSDRSVLHCVHCVSGPHRSIHLGHPPHPSAVQHQDRLQLQLSDGHVYGPASH